jgi:hypothetical protein
MQTLFELGGQIMPTKLLLAPNLVPKIIKAGRYSILGYFADFQKYCSLRT